MKNREMPLGEVSQRIRIETLTPLNREDDLSEIRTGLMKTPREISSKFFYDSRGSALFERICELPEYYPTRTELALLERYAVQLTDLTSPDVLVELGSGSSVKTRVLLDAMEREGCLACYAPIELSESLLQGVVSDLALDYPGFRFHGVAGDFTRDSGYIPDGDRRLVLFLGGTVGNFRPSQAVSVLSGVCDQLRPGEFLLLGTDLVKDINLIESAYNDSQGITAEFNLNILRVLNMLLDSDLDTSLFEHRAIYSQENNRIEMRLRSISQQKVCLKKINLDFELQEGEEIITEFSTKYNQSRLEKLLEASGFEMIDFLTAPENMFSLSLSRKI